MDILRFATAGSVDDGKSTLIGRLVYSSPRSLLVRSTAAS
jgi:sulfate adenylyltransferase subunit 1 (EFTu-like GTPase family)